MSASIYEFESNILKTLSHPARIQILEFLKENKLCQCEMALLLNIEQYNFSRHISALRSAGILRTWKEGVRLMFEVTNPCVYDILDNVRDLLKYRVKAEQNLLTLQVNHKLLLNEDN